MVKRLLFWFRGHSVIVRYPVLKEMTKFGLVGVVNTTLDFLVYTGLTRSLPFFFVHYLWANFIAFSFAATSSYVFNRVWTFRNRHQNIGAQYTKFFLAASVGLLISEAVLFVFVGRFGVHDLLAKIAAIGLTMIWNFSMNKLWIFRSEDAMDISGARAR